MMRDTHTARGRGTTVRIGGSRGATRRPSRLAARLRAVCLLLCVALALQPSLLTSGRAASSARVRPAGASQLSLMESAARPVFAVATSVASFLRSAAPAPEVVAVPAAHLEAYGPEPAAFFLSAPSAVSVDSVSDSQVALSWTPVSGAASYRVERSPDIQTPYSAVGSPAGNSFQDAGLTRGDTYLYRVRAVDSAGTSSPPSPVLMATAITFTDAELVGANDSQGRPATKVKAAHVDDLRLAVAGVRRAAALPAVTWAEEVRPGETVVKASHVEELREKLDEALSALGLSHPPYTDSALHTGANGTPVRKAHFEELRSYATYGSGVTGSGPASYDFASARLDASNRTGGGGVDLVSRNFNWSLPLVSLPGRAGLDLGLSLAYNSLVWTKSGNSVLFDGDGGWPAPGFRLGFAVVQGKFHDSQAQKDAYLLVTPSGARVSLRRVGTTAVYEAGDSSYLQLTEEPDGTLTLRPTDGTRMSYRPQGGVYKCAEIKDRNGNFITVSYNTFDDVQTVTDTLGRVLTFGYDGGHLDEITQTWHREVESGSSTQVVTETHRWAKFYYADKAVQTNFAGLNVFGPADGQSIHALTKVTLDDSSSFTFNYTTWGQVNQVAAYAADNRLLNYVSLDLPVDATSPQTDCPRPTERRDWAAYWNGDADGAGAASEEAVTTYGPYDFASGVAKAGAPDGTLHKETYETSGWKKGLTTRADEFSADDLVHPKKWTVLAWTQDDESLPYQQNPRVRETNVYDSMEDGTDNPRNRRRTEVVYTSFGLVQDVKEYDSAAAAVLRRAHTEYVPDSVDAGGAYTLRRIIGLPRKREVYGLDGGQERRFSKVTFEYDLAPGGGTQYLVDAGAVAQHDGAYGLSFAMRGNACLARRWDAASPDDASKTVASELVYDTNGSAVVTGDALGRRTTISYAGPGGAGGLAYPTKVTDPDDFFSAVEYNYDTGAVTRAVDPKGAATKVFYDSAGRVLKSKNEATGAYVGHDYGASGLYSRLLTKADTNKPETFAMTVADGAGRVRGTLRELPGSSGGYAAQRLTYDVMGRRHTTSNPAEVSANANDLSDVGSWEPAGDDAPANGGTGWVYTTQTYDWKGRPRFTTNPDNTTRNVSYDGCGCAGGEVVSLVDELGRLSKVYTDSLGRGWKSEVFKWEGTDFSVYSTTTTTYDALDRAVRVRQYAGAAPQPEPQSEGAGYQTATMTYDGHGRLKASHTPEETDANGSPLSTQYEYNTDDTVHMTTDARGATTTYTYNNRGLVTAVGYGVAAGVTKTWDDAAAVTYAYDAAGNRTSMTDGLGSVSYTYDTASRLTSESRTLSALTGHAPFQLSYEYTTSGALKKLTDPAGDSVTYEFNAAGQITDVNGSTFASVTNYASQIKYRAWGGQKSVKYGDTPNAATTTYDARMRPYEYTLNVPATPSTLGTGMRERFEYYEDGRLKQMTDLDDRSVNNLGEPPADRRFSRRYTYDHAGRITSANGVNAAGNDYYLPFRQSYTYDAFDNVTTRTGSYYYEGLTSDIAQYQNDRRQDWTYDNSGNVTHSPIPSTVSGETKARDWTYDSAGRLVKAIDTKTSNGTTTTKTYTSKYDGDGNAVFEQGEQYPGSAYIIRSTPLGGATVTRLNSAGDKFKTNVIVDGLLTATQDTSAATFGSPSVSWMHKDPAGLSEVTTTTADKKSVYDPSGNYISYQTPPAPATGYNPFFNPPPSGSLGSGFGFNGGSTNVTCTLDGTPTDCGRALHALALGNAAPCPDNNCGAHWNGHAFQFPHFTSDGLFYGGVNPYGSSGNRPTLKTATPEDRQRHRRIVTRSGHNPFGESSAEEVVFDFIGFNFRGIGIAPQNPMKDGANAGTPCSDALKAADKTVDAVNRANLSMDTLKEVAAKYDNVIDWKTLAAIGVRESGFQNIDEYGGGRGRGVFQISTGVSRSITSDVRASAIYVMENRLLPQYKAYEKTYGPGELALMGAIRDYNHTAPTTPGLLNNAYIKGDFGGMDADTAPYRASDRKKPGNYVSNVLNIARNCF